MLNKSELRLYGKQPRCISKNKKISINSYILFTVNHLGSERVIEKVIKIDDYIHTTNWAVPRENIIKILTKQTHPELYL